MNIILNHELFQPKCGIIGIVDKHGENSKVQ